MKSFINYQGSKANIIDFIVSGIQEYTNVGDTVLDIFSGSGAVSSALKKYYRVIANDAEPYSAAINTAILCSSNLDKQFISEIETNILKYKHELIRNENLTNVIAEEKFFIKHEDLDGILKIYSDYNTVWNDSGLTPKILKEKNEYNLFTRYFATSYFGIEQAIEIDAIIKTIKTLHINEELMYSCLFYAMKETVFSRDGHMAQPLNFLKNPKRGFLTRNKSVIGYFINISKTCHSEEGGDNHSFENAVFNKPFEDLIENKDLLESVDLIYADPPYTDMQYSRYYHLLNVAIQYDYPELTKTSRGFTTGLYTEGRFQSDLSKQSKAKSQFELLMKKCTEYNINLALSYAYPQNKKTQATDRYTISIEELIDMAKSTFSPELVKVSQINYNHTNHKNKHNKPVIEYLILCGKNKKVSRTYDISNFKKTIYDMKPTNRNPVYNTHLYWSQKSFNIIDALIENFSDQNNVIFDPFLGSGVTILEAIKKETNRNAIGCDVNECPVFIVKTLLNDSFSQNAEHELKRFMEFINTLQRYYTINCPNCSNKAIIDRIIFDKPERSKSDVSIKAVNIKCMTCNTKNIDPKSYDFASDMFQIYRYSNINSEFEYIKNSKIAVIENDRITNIFTSRNLKVIDEIISMSLSFSKETQNIIKYVLMSIMHQCKISDKRSNSQWPLWVPKKDCVERNVICLLQGKMNGFIKALKTIRTNYKKGSIVENFSEIKQNNALILHKGSQLITDEEVPDNSVDLIITDPPYLEQVLYSEYMQLYAPILNLDFNLEDEIVVSTGENREKDKTNYYELLGSVFSLCRDKLKKNKLMCLYFHDSNLDVWYRLIKILYELGFDFKGQVHIKKNVTLKNIISPQKSLNGDSILFFNNSKRTRDYVGGSESIEEIELNLVREAKFMISNSGPLSTPELYDNGLMEILIQNGWLKKAAEEYKTLIDVFQKHLLWDKELAKWYIKTKE